MKKSNAMNRMTLYYMTDSNTLFPKFITLGQLTHTPAEHKRYRDHT